MYSVDRTTKGANLFVGETIVSCIILINNMLSCIWNCILCWTFVKSYAVPVRVFYSPVHGCWMLDTNIFHSPHSYLFKECVMPNAVVTSENDPEVEMLYPQNRKKDETNISHNSWCDIILNDFSVYYYFILKYHLEMCTNIQIHGYF